MSKKKELTYVEAMKILSMEIHPEEKVVKPIPFDELLLKTMDVEIKPKKKKSRE